MKLLVSTIIALACFTGASIVLGTIGVLFIHWQWWVIMLCLLVVRLLHIIE